MEYWYSVLSPLSLTTKHEHSSCSPFVRFSLSLYGRHVQYSVQLEPKNQREHLQDVNPLFYCFFFCNLSQLEIPE
jgi:hypothetical protein